MFTDDLTSISILKTIAQVHLRPAASELPSAPELHFALATAFGSTSPAPVSEGDLAHAALDLLRQDPALAQDIQLAAIQVGTSGSPQRYLDPLTIPLVTAALLALQTRVTFTLDSDHKWSIKVDKKSSGDAVVKLLVQRLLPFLSK